MFTTIDYAILYARVVQVKIVFVDLCIYILCVCNLMVNGKFDTVPLLCTGHDCLGNIHFHILLAQWNQMTSHQLVFKLKYKCNQMYFYLHKHFDCSMHININHFTSQNLGFR